MLSTILVSFLVVYIVVLFFLIHFHYNTFLSLKRKEEPGWKEKGTGYFIGKNGGSWMGGNEYWFRAPIPLVKEKNESIEVSMARKKHNKAVAILWISFFTVVPIIIVILNLIEGG
ncbi:hypothetical protein [Parvicella tangerina]|uniref:DUF5808 domain-containing protein n=1 Tax=Parvicella tangerina TaxID=2829795 RepID=A0A916JMN0_9FLAO|nr:hypothetical protein [Parvicella tangerina]CAG5081288.1 hypothetical protein CRYO30217_01583 [Parvicella tangerina]